MSAVKFPGHEWNGSPDGHNCQDCTEDVWRCDPVAHNLGVFEGSLRLLDAIENHSPEQELADDYERNDHQ